MNKLVSRNIALMAVLLGVSLPVRVLAENLEETVVQGQQRTEAQNGLALQSLSAADVQAAQITHSSELAKLSPSLTVLQSLDQRQSAIFIRGLGTLSFGAGVQASVVTLVDDVAMASPAQASIPLQAIEAVEILRGPQGWLTGKSAAAGSVHIRSKRPAETWQGQLETRLSHGSESSARARYSGLSISGPMGGQMGGQMGLSGSLFYQDNDGYIENVYDNSQLNGRLGLGGRLGLHWADDSSQVALRADYAKHQGACCAPVITRADAPLYQALLPPVEASKENRQANSNRDYRNDSRDAGLSLQWQKTLSNSRLSSVSAYRKYTASSEQDLDFLPQDFIPLSAGEDQLVQLSQKLQISQDAQLFSYRAGVYFLQQRRQHDYSRGVLSLFNASLHAAVRTREMAAYMHAETRLREDTVMALGLRYGRDTIRFSARRDAFAPQGLQGFENANDSQADKVLGGTLALRQHWSTGAAAHQLSLRWSRMHKPAAYNVLFAMDAEQLSPVSREQGDSVELGLKSVFYQQGLSVEAMLYATRYADFQAQVQQGDRLKYALINSGDVSTQGLELALNAQHWRYWHTSLSLNWMAARIGDVAGIACAAGCDSLYGKPLPFAPDVKASLSTRYQSSISATGVQRFFGLNYVWQSEIQTAFNNDRFRAQGAYGLLDVSAGIAWQKLQLTVFVHNLFNRQFAVAIFEHPLGQSAYAQFLSAQAERRIGLGINVQF